MQFVARERGVTGDSECDQHDRSNEPTAHRDLLVELVTKRTTVSAEAVRVPRSGLERWIERNTEA